LLLKSTDPLERYLVELVQAQGMLGSHEHADSARTTVHQQACVMAFHEFAGYLNEAFGLDKDYAIGHDVRINCEAGRAHIDHLIISRTFDIFLIESRIAGDELRVGENEEFTSRYRDGAAFRIRSPATQLRRSLAVMQHIFRSIELPERFGMKLVPRFHRFVVLPAGCTITNSSSIDPQQFVRPKELLRAVIGASRTSSLRGFMSSLSPDQMRDIGRIVVRWHTPDKVDFIGKYRAQAIVTA